MPPSNKAARQRTTVTWAFFTAKAAIPVSAYYAGRESTDDAQVDGDIVPISARITGTVIEILIHDNEAVKAGQPLVRLDPADYPVPNFSAGGIATPADASLVMQLGAEAVFVGSGIFKSSDPAARANAIVKAAKNFNNPEKLLEASRALGEAMPGLDVSKMPESELMQTRGW